MWNPSGHCAKCSKENGVSESGIKSFDAETATTKQKGNFGEYKADYNLVHNQSLKDAGYDLKPIGRPAPTSLDDKIVKGIDGIYKNQNPESPIKYIIDEAKYGTSTLSTTKKHGKQMSNPWLTCNNSNNNRILKAVEDEELALDIQMALSRGQVERVLSKVDEEGNVTTYKLDNNGDIIGTWP